MLLFRCLYKIKRTAILCSSSLCLASQKGFEPLTYGLEERIRAFCIIGRSRDKPCIIRLFDFFIGYCWFTFGDILNCLSPYYPQVIPQKIKPPFPPIPFIPGNDTRKYWLCGPNSCVCAYESANGLTNRSSYGQITLC
jgi:hypothetical protein